MRCLHRQNRIYNRHEAYINTNEKPLKPFSWTQEKFFLAIPGKGSVQVLHLNKTQFKICAIYSADTA